MILGSLRSTTGARPQSRLAVKRRKGDRVDCACHGSYIPSAEAETVALLTNPRPMPRRSAPASPCMSPTHVHRKWSGFGGRTRFLRSTSETVKKPLSTFEEQAVNEGRSNSSMGLRSPHMSSIPGEPRHGCSPSAAYPGFQVSKWRVKYFLWDRDRRRWCGRC